LRRIFKPEFIRSDKRVVKIPDIEFEPEPLPQEPESDEENAEGEAVPEEVKPPVLTEELREQIAAEIREELAGELGRKKIAAQKECSVILRDAKNEAEVILAQANAERERIMAEASVTAQQLRTDAYNEGAKSGFEDKKTLLENLALYISHSIEEIKKERNQFFEEYAKQLKYLSVDICEKIISHKIEEDDMVMYGVIKDALRYVRDTKWVKAEVSAELSGYVDSLEKELQAQGQNVEFIFSQNIPKDTCILNTSNGLVDATISEQLKNLREFIDSLDKGDSDESKS
ncbi:MAG: hypothetical protein IJA12_05135, partial [Oscillospiraceae bacterium]|nr:hypothetical protein [Oscillospiraceae bacterium]